jgi:RimJ/RimL family protein N-acetyltransferase
MQPYGQPPAHSPDIAERLRSAHAQHAVVLRDGARLLLRPLRTTDREFYLRSFDHLSDRSRYMRFFSPKKLLSDRELRYFLDVDHHDHEAVCAIDVDGGAGGVGVARYVRDLDDPAIAEVSVTVVDEWQGRGLGGALLASLASRAVEEGVVRFRASVLADNDRMLRLIRRRWPRHTRRSLHAGVVELEFEIRPEVATSRLPNSGF